MCFLIRVINKINCRFTHESIFFLQANPTQQELSDLFAESTIMLDFDHPNVMKLLGVCFDANDNIPLIILPFMANGDLKSFLTKKRRRESVISNPSDMELPLVKK